MNNQIIKIQRVTRKRDLRYSVIVGIFSFVKMGFTLNFVTPFALALKANNLHIGVLNAIPQLFAALSQLKSADVVEKIKNRIKTVSVFVFMEAVMWIPVLLIPFFSKGLLSVWLVIFFVSIITIFGSVIIPPWLSLMSDIVPRRIYGKYFAWRGRILGFVAIVAGFIAGFLLDLFSKNVFYGFVVIFGIASISRFLSSYYISRMTDIPLKITSKERFSYFQFIARLRESNFAKFTLYVAGLNFGRFIAAPFFVVYMLRELKFSYTTYILISLAGSVAGLMSLPFWGKYADRIGNIKIVKISSIFIPLIPIVWLFSKNVLYLVLMTAFAGYVWAGFDLCSRNFIYDVAIREKRQRCVAYFNVTGGVFMCLGGLLGGCLVSHLPKFSGSNILSLFLLSGIIRALVVSLFSGSFKEVRPSKKIKDREFIYTILGIKPGLALIQDVRRMFHRH